MDAILEQVLDHVGPLFVRQELVGDDLEHLILVLNVTELLINTLSGWLLVRRRLNNLTVLIKIGEFLVEVDGVTGQLFEFVAFDLLGDLV